MTEKETLWIIGNSLCWSNPETPRIFYTGELNLEWHPRTYIMVSPNSSLRKKAYEKACYYCNGPDAPPQKIRLRQYCIDRGWIGG